MRKTYCMQKRMRRLLAVAGILSVLLFTMPAGAAKAYAYDNTMETKSFNVDVKVNENNSYDFSETIDMNYITPHHGIYRYIPINGSKISRIRVPGYDYDTYTQSGNTVIKIGSGSYTLTGENRYQIGYSLALYDDENAEKDMLLINVIPTGWETDIYKASGTVTLPKDTDLSKVQVYSGTYGTEGNEDNVQIKVDEASRTITYSATNLPARHGITITTELPQGYWVGAPEFGKVSPFTMLLALLGPIGAFILWWLYGRDKHMVKTLEFYPPEDLSPGELGYVIDGSADKEDIVSTIVYLADKGYITIEEKGDAYEFTAVERPGSEVPSYVSTIYDGIFRNGKRDKAMSDKLGVEFGRKFQKARTLLASMYTGSKAITRPDSKMARVGAAIASLVPIYAFTSWQGAYGSDSSTFSLIFGSIHILIATAFLCSAFDKLRTQSKIKTILKALAATWFTWFGLAVVLLDYSDFLYQFDSNPIKGALMQGLMVFGTLISMFFAVVSIARTDSYTDLLGRTLGFRDFIKTAELDKINELVESDPEYFYHILPYAYVFKLTNKWIKKFENIPMVQPTWYVGDDRYGYFDGYTMGRMMSSCSSSVADNIVIPQSSSGGSFGGSSGGGGWSGGGGFSGGGFSGGGVGGGGGGGW